MTPTFVPGLELARRFYEQAVRPLLRDAFPNLAYTAARLGSGSEVLGYDTERSADHEWGPRLQLFLSPQDARRHGRDVVSMLAHRLPKDFLGWPTSFGPADAAIRVMQRTEGPVAHRVDVTDPGTWFGEQLGFDPRVGVTNFDWLATPGQRLAETVGGAVFHDGTGLEQARGRLGWYPDPLWRYLLACQWQRIGQEEAFPGRCAEVGDDLGSQVIVARLARDLMRLCLLMERRYAPYSKWLGSAFAALPCAGMVGPALRGALAARTWSQREVELARAYVEVAKLHNDLRLTPALAPTTRPYYDRPFSVIDATRFVAALRDSIPDPEVRELPLVGSVDQFVDSTDVLAAPHLARAVAAGVFGRSPPPPPPPP